MIKDPLYQTTFTSAPTKPVSTFAQIPPRSVFRIDYDLMQWANPWTGVVNTPYWLHNDELKWMFLHHGGGSNAAGDLIEEPELTLKQRIALHFGVCRGVLRTWESWHILGREMKGVAYDYFITQYGKVIRGRGWRANGGQWGNTPNRWNNTSLAINWIGGEGQTMRKAAWRALGRMWVEASYGLPQGQAFKLRPHNFTNSDSPATACPGAERTRLVYAEHHLAALGRLRLRKLRLMRGGTVQTLTRGLTIAGFYDQTQKRYSAQVARAVRMFQQYAGIPVDGIVGPVTWQLLAEKVSIL